ncbi:Eosinophil peroxidase, partial [Nibea albiflora]
CLPQVFVFRDYLPHILGPNAMRNQIGTYRGYNPNVDPSISNVFATAAYRFAHLAIQPVLGRLDANYRENNQFPSVPLFKAFFTPWRVVFEGGIDPLLRGLIGRPAKLNVQNHMMVDALRERLFQFVQHLALDLGSLNMERGRDHGLPGTSPSSLNGHLFELSPLLLFAYLLFAPLGYNAWRKMCGLSQPKNQAELARVLNNSNLARKLLQHYGTPDNIDVWLGGVAEPLVPGGRVGPLFVCLIARQFRNVRAGDRLWYQNRGVFTPAQRNALATASLSRIICDNTGINTVPTKVFDVLSRSNRLVRCSSIRSLNLTPWRERICSENSGPVGPPGPPGQPAHNISASQPQSAFSVYLGKYNPSFEKIIHFRQVIDNQQGHYIAKTGVFTCVIPGVYQFTFLCTSFKVGRFELQCNEKTILRGFRVYFGGRHLASGDTVIRLDKGDKVWLEATDGTYGLSTQSYFSGHLLYTV